MKVNGHAALIGVPGEVIGHSVVGAEERRTLGVDGAVFVAAEALLEAYRVSCSLPQHDGSTYHLMVLRVMKEGTT